MSRRTVGLTMVGVGALLIIIGAISLVASSGSEEVASSPTTTTTFPSSTTLPPASTPTTTSSTPTTTSTTSATTTTTTLPSPSVADFIDAYAAAVEQGDADFLFDRLLPDVTGAFGAQLCRNWIEREILALSDYQVTGDIAGPFSRTLSVGDAAIPVENYYEGQVSFTFQGQSFDAQATWVIADGQVFWVGECR